MTTLNIDISNKTIDSYILSGSINDVKVVFSGIPDKWNNKTIFATFIQDEKDLTEEVINNMVDVPISIVESGTDFYIGLYAVPYGSSNVSQPTKPILIHINSEASDGFNIQNLANAILKVNALSHSLANVAFTGDYNDLNNRPVVDQKYDAKSKNAQSGVAVAQAIAQLVGSAPDKLNTLEELADALKDNADIVDVFNEAIGGKVDKADGYGLSQIDYGTNISGQSFVVLNTVNVDNEPVQIFLYPIAETNALLALKADKSNHSDGFEGGRGASAESGGGAVGKFAQSYGGGSIGNYTFAMGGGAIGYKAETGDGFAGGYCARTVTNDEGIAIDAIQLGTGQNTQPGTLQIYNYTLMNADGRIPAERMAVTPITEIPATLSPNASYNFGAVESLHTAFPAIANDGDVIYLTFMVGGANPNITIDFTEASDIDIEIVPNTGYEIYGKYNGAIWIVGYSEYTVTDGEAV